MPAGAAPKEPHCRPSLIARQSPDRIYPHGPEGGDEHGSSRHRNDEHGRRNKEGGGAHTCPKYIAVKDMRCISPWAMINTQRLRFTRTKKTQNTSPITPVVTTPASP